MLQELQPISSPILYAVILPHKRYIILAAILPHGENGVVRAQILGDWERRILEAYLKGERLKGYSGLLSDIRKMGLRRIIDGCEHDLTILKRLLQKDTT